MPLTLGELESVIERLSEYVNQEAKLADKSSHDWAKESDLNLQSAYRAGMWYAYNDIRNRLPKTNENELPI